MAGMNLALLAAVVLCAEPSDSPIRVGVGTQEIVKSPGLTRAALADPAVADVTVTNAATGELLILGKKAGRTTLTIWTKGRSKPASRPIIVDDGKFAELAQLVKEKVDPTLKCEVYGERLVIDGELDSVEDYQRLKTLVAEQAGVKLLVRLNPMALPALAAAINAELRKHGLANATAKAVGNRLVLEGSVTDEKEREKAQLIAESFYSDFSGK